MITDSECDKRTKRSSLPAAFLQNEVRASSTVCSLLSLSLGTSALTLSTTAMQTGRVVSEGCVSPAHRLSTCSQQRRTFAVSLVDLRALGLGSISDRGSEQESSSKVHKGVHSALKKNDTSTKCAPTGLNHFVEIIAGGHNCFSNPRARSIPPWPRRLTRRRCCALCTMHHRVKTYNVSSRPCESVMNIEIDDELMTDSCGELALPFVRVNTIDLCAIPCITHSLSVPPMISGEVSSSSIGSSQPEEQGNQQAARRKESLLPGQDQVRKVSPGLHGPKPIPEEAEVSEVLFDWVGG